MRPVLKLAYVLLLAAAAVYVIVKALHATPPVAERTASWTEEREPIGGGMERYTLRSSDPAIADATIIRPVPIPRPDPGLVPTREGD